MPREVELKSVVEDVAACRRRLETAGARMTFEGRLEDRRYDTADRRLSAADEVLRLRTYHDARGARAALEWKGPTRQEHGYKVRDEVNAHATDPAELAAILERLGYLVIGEIDRSVVQYGLDDAVIRFEHYPRMDALVEVEGPPPSIEHAIVALGMPRGGFTADRLLTFVARFEARTGSRAALSDRQLADDDSTGTIDA
jgi:predicted adenylyl cyclase CyaB